MTKFYLSRKSALALLLFVGSSAWAADPALTIYNQNFAVVRDRVPLDLKEGVHDFRFSGITAHLEPDSVILRDPEGKIELKILEQNYRADPVSQDLLLALNEGQTIDFLVQEENKSGLVQGKIIRSGYVPRSLQGAAAGAEPSLQPIIEIFGKLRFQLPGIPLFPPLPDDTVLKPTLTWKIETGGDAKLDAELAYVTGGLSWHADYNIVAPASGDLLDLVGWVTMENQSGKSFENAHIKLMAGDVSKIEPEARQRPMPFGAMAKSRMAEPAVTEKTFDEYHLYTLQRPATLHDGETKQVEFIRAMGVHSQRVYLYDGLKIPEQYRGWNYENIRAESQYGTESNSKVAVMQEFQNLEDNSLGMPLPKGRIRFYRRDHDGQLEFTGENEIDHTPKNETVRIVTGNAFDLTGERRRTDFKIDNSKSWADESFEIKVRNRKKEEVEIRVVEHLYRWTNWEITEKSTAFQKIDAQTIEFRVAVKPDEEKVITYTVHYSW